MPHRIVNLGISSEQDMVAVRQRSREISGGLGFGAQDQVRIATAVSELARTAFAYASGGNVAFSLDHLGSDASLQISIKTPGGDTRSASNSRGNGAVAALQQALVSARRLMDECTMEEDSDRTRILMLRKALPDASAVTAAMLSKVAARIAANPVSSSFNEVTLQNKELLDTLAELRTKQDDLLALTEELEKTNRGVVALYAEIEEKAERLREADVHKDEFLATLAHELRNPLAPIRNAVEVMRRVDPANIASHARAQQIISRQVDHLARLVDDLLDVARISKGKITLRQVVADVQGFIHTAVETIQPFIDQRRHQLSVVIPDEVLQVSGDPVRLAQIVGNLLNNAAKYTLSGGTILLKAEQRADRRLRITVKDNGIGLSPERIRTVFGMFAQGEAAPDRAQDGLGIGLSLVRQLVTLHGGEVWVESEGPGHGSSFILELPLLEAGVAELPALTELVADMPKPADVAPSVVLKTSPAHAAGGELLRILLVDDNVDLVMMTAVLLQTAGHETFVAHDAGQAMAQARQHAPELILLDIGLPGTDGYQVARMLRQQPDLRNATLVAITGYGTDEDRRKAFEAGFDHHLVKPVEVQALLAIVAATVPRHAVSSGG
jgi:signal transduction histidine kinase/ActR/RegA family two-component response regulator